MLSNLLFAAGALCALVYWPLSGGAPSDLRSALKTGSTAALALAAALAGASLWLIAGLALGAAGDFALSRRGDGWFRAGLGAFLLGHLAYAALFLTWPIPAAPGGAALALALVLLAFCGVMTRLLWPAAGALRVPVLAYVAVIAAMGLTSLALPLPHPGQLAALLFIASDAVLATELFLVPPGRPARSILPFVVWPLYWLAQALFLASFAFQNPV